MSQPELRPLSPSERRGFEAAWREMRAPMRIAANLDNVAKAAGAPVVMEEVKVAIRNFDQYCSRHGFVATSKGYQVCFESAAYTRYLIRRHRAGCEYEPTYRKKRTTALDWARAQFKDPLFSPTKIEIFVTSDPPCRGRTPRWERVELIKGTQDE